MGVDFSMRPLKESLRRLLEGKGNEAALAYLDKLIEVNKAVGPDNTEQERRLLEQRQLFEFGRDFIRKHPGEWFELLGRADAPAPKAKADRSEETTILYIGFEGDVNKKVEDAQGKTQVHRRDTRGEFLPVDPQDKQSNDTAILLDLVTEGNLDAIERMGYKIKRATKDEEPDEET